MPRTKHVPTELELAQIITSAAAPMDLCLILMADAGCRLREALAFDVSSLSPDASLLRVWSTKVQRWRTLPTTRRLRAAVSALACAALPTLNPRWVQRRLNDITDSLGIPRTSPHRLRHSYATRLFVNGVPAHLIMQLLGHKSIALTFHYIATDQDQMLAAAKALDQAAANQ